MIEASAGDWEPRWNPPLAAGWPKTLYAVPSPPAKPTIRIAEASAGEKRTWRSQFAGSKASRRQKPPCSAVSRASCSRMRDAASRFGVGSCARSCESRAWNSLLCFQFGRAVGAALHVLLQFMAGVVGQLAINMQRDIFSYPFALHKS